MSINGIGSLVRLEGRIDALAYQRVQEDHMLPDAQRVLREDFVVKHVNALIHTLDPPGTACVLMTPPYTVDCMAPTISKRQHN